MGCPRTPPEGRPEPNEEGEHVENQEERQSVQTPRRGTPRVRRPRVMYSPSPPASTMVGLGRPKFRRVQGQSQEFLDSPEIQAAGRVNGAARPRLQGTSLGGQEVAREVVVEQVYTTKLTSLITFFKRLHIIYPHNHLVVVKALGLGKTAGWRAPAVERWRETESLTLPPGPGPGCEEQG